jgi:hypothetical protein
VLAQIQVPGQVYVPSMTTKTTSATERPDPAAVFASALSLWLEYKKRDLEGKLNLSECFNGMDEFMRKLMRVASQFESWASLHINFNELNDVWPYLLEDRFGEVCSAVLSDDLAQFDDSDCLRVAMRLRLPIILDDKLPVPIDVTALNPVLGSPFREFRIQTVRDLIEDGDAIPYSADDEPFDEEFGPPYFSLYGVDEDGLLEQIADRKTYSEAMHLAEKLALGVAFPNSPTCVSRPAS